MNLIKDPLRLLIFVVVLAAMVAVVWVAMTHFGIIIPGFVITIFWICVCAFIVVGALVFLASLLGWRMGPPPG